MTQRNLRNYLFSQLVSQQEAQNKVVFRTPIITDGRKMNSNKMKELTLY